MFFTVKPDSGVSAKSFKADDKVYISTEKLLPLSRFTGGGGGGGGRGGGGRGAWLRHRHALGGMVRSVCS